MPLLLVGPFLQEWRRILRRMAFERVMEMYIMMPLTQNRADWESPPCMSLPSPMIRHSKWLAQLDPQHEHDIPKDLVIRSRK